MRDGGSGVRFEDLKEMEEMEVSWTFSLEGNDGDGGAGVILKMRRKWVKWKFCRLADLEEMREMEEPGSVLKI